MNDERATGNDNYRQFNTGINEAPFLACATKWLQRYSYIVARELMIPKWSPQIQWGFCLTKASLEQTDDQQLSDDPANISSIYQFNWANMIWSDFPNKFNNN